jgi:hypothetical protein
MIRHNQWSIKLTEMMNLPAQTTQRGVGGQEVLRRDAPHREHNVGPQQLNLAHEVRKAGNNFLGLGITIARRPAFQHVGNVHVAAATESDCLEHGIQEVAGTTDERLTSAILFSAGGFADY